MEDGPITPMPKTPEQAVRTGNRWRRIGAVFCVLAFVVALFSRNSPLTFIGIIAGSLCFMEARGAYGWAEGHRACTAERDHERL